MPPVRPILCGTLHLPRLLPAIIMTLLFASAPLLIQAQVTNPVDDGRAAVSAESTETIAVGDVRPGMQGYAYTIFAGDQIERFDLVVIGVLDNFMGPRESIILVQLKGEKVEHTGVVAGMSGSPVYLEGKLAGALSLKLGVFTKEPIAGVTPIHEVLDPLAPAGGTKSTTQNFSRSSQATDAQATNAQAINSQAAGIGFPAGSALEPIETPLVFSGFPAGSLQPFAAQIQSFGFVAAQGGTTAPRSDDAHLVAGDMAGMVLVQGDASIDSACTVTAVRGENVFLCG